MMISYHIYIIHTVTAALPHSMFIIIHHSPFIIIIKLIYIYLINGHRRHSTPASRSASVMPDSDADATSAPDRSTLL